MNFKPIFRTIVLFSVLSGGTAVALSFQPRPTPHQEAIIGTCTDSWKLCMGTIVGLLGGRNLNDNDDDEE